MIYCEKFKDYNNKQILIDFLELKTINTNFDEYYKKNQLLFNGENVEDTYRYNKLSWMFNTSMYNFSSASFEVEINSPLKYNINTLIDSISTYIIAFRLESANIKLVSKVPLDIDDFVNISNCFTNNIACSSISDKISISYDVELVIHEKVSLSNFLFANMNRSSITIDIRKFQSIYDIDDYIAHNNLNVYYDVAQIPVYNDNVRCCLIELIKENSKNINVFVRNEFNIPIEIYNEALEMFFVDNDICVKKGGAGFSVNKFESVCYSAFPNEFIIDESGNIRKCKHNNNSKTIVGTIINGSFEIDFSKFLRWTTPDNKLLHKKNCFDCFYYPCCLGMSCKYFEIIRHELYCPQKFQNLKRCLIKEERE